MSFHRLAAWSGTAKRSWLVAVVCFLVVLAGCSDGGTASSPTPSASPAGTATPMATPSTADATWFDLERAGTYRFAVVENDVVSYITVDVAPSGASNTTMAVEFERSDGTVLAGSTSGSVVMSGDLSVLGRLTTGTGNDTADQELLGRTATTLGLLLLGGSLGEGEDLSVGAQWIPENGTGLAEVTGVGAYGGVPCYTTVAPYPGLGPNATLEACLTGGSFAVATAIVGEYNRIAVELVEYRPG